MVQRTAPDHEHAQSDLDLDPCPVEVGQAEELSQQADQRGGGAFASHEEAEAGDSRERLTKGLISALALVV